MNMMTSKKTALSLVALVALAVVAPAQMLLTYNPGDLFIGFRQDGTANTLAVKIGTASQFLTPTFGGTATAGSSFNVQFGVIPSTSTQVFDLNTDLTAVFGSTWSNNPGDGTGVRWAVVGFTKNSGNDVPIVGYNARTLFVTRARPEPTVQSTVDPAPSAIGNRTGFAAAFNGFTVGGLGAYAGNSSTANSSVAYIGATADANNWGTRIDNGSPGSFGLGGGNEVEQASAGDYSGPTDSVLDLWISPNTGSTLLTKNTYAGSFTLNNAGQLSFTAVPEPSTYALLALAGVAAIAMRWRQRRRLATATDR